MKFGPDGALYLADWMRGWEAKNEGRIWKVDSPTAASSAARIEVRSLLAQNFDARAAADLGVLLQHADMRVRLKAQFELVRRADVTTLRLAARRADHQLATDPRPLGHRAAGPEGPAALRRSSRSSSTTPIPRSGRKPPG